MNNVTLINIINIINIYITCHRDNSEIGAMTCENEV